MNKTDLIAKVSEETNINANTTKQVLEGILEAIQDAVENGENVQLVGFGSWNRVHREAREARNPATGATITVPEHDVPTFSFGKKFKDRVKNHK